MIFIFGFGKQSVKEYGATAAQICGRCRNRTPLALAKVTSWFTLFFISLIPYSSKYMLICPVCGQARELSKEEFEDLLSRLPDSDDEPAMQTRGGAGPWQDEEAEDEGSWPLGGPGRRQIPGERGAGHSRPVSDAVKYAGKTPTQIAYLKKIEAHERAQAALEKEQETNEAD